MRPLVETAINLHSNNVYEIAVGGSIDLSWLKGFGEVEVQPEGKEDVGHDRTRFRIVTDQTGLVGLVRRMHGLGVVLLSISQV